MRQHTNGHQADVVAGWLANVSTMQMTIAHTQDWAACLGGLAACRGLPAVSVVLALARASSALVGSRRDSNCVLTPHLTQKRN